MKIVNKELLDEVRKGSCELCGCGGPCDPHHLFERGAGGGNRLDVRWNLIALCRECHQAVQGQKSRLWELCFLVIRREVWRLQRMSKEEFREINTDAIDF